MDKNVPPLYLLDSYGMLYRAYFAFISKPLRNPEGKNISALFGFVRSLVSVLDMALGPQAAEGGLGGAAGAPSPLMAAVFDAPGPTFRHLLFPAYKATRPKTPQELHAQVPLVEEVLAALKIRALKIPGYEADDIIATLAARCKAAGRACYIVSSDKDLLQLVGDGVFVLQPSKNYEGIISMDEAAVRARWGVAPQRLLDLLALIGDSADNVPGVRGVGEKTALKLLARYGSLEEIYKSLAGIDTRVAAKLAADRENAFLSKKLITLDCAAPLSLPSLEELSLGSLDRAAGAFLLQREGLYKFATDLDGRKVATRERSAEAKGAAAAAGGDEPALKAEGPLNTPEALLGEGRYALITTLQALEEVLAKAKERGCFALDFETDSLDALNANVVGFSLSLEPKEAFYVPLAAHGESAEEKAAAPRLDAEKVRALLAPFFADRAMTIAAHNAKFDYEVSRHWGLPRWECVIWDTMIAAWLLEQDRGTYALDFLALFHFKYTPLKFNDVVPKGKTFDAVPLDKACRYSAEDADLCMRLRALFLPRLEEMQAVPLFAGVEMPLLPVLAEMEKAGIKIEKEALDSYSVELASKLKRLEAETWREVGHEFNLSSPKQLQTVLFDERGLKSDKKTAGGSRSTDVSVLESLAAEDRVPELILRHRSLSKLKSTYVDTLGLMADANGRIHTNFVQTGTATGRLSSREPNLQNIPIRDEEGRRIREAFVAEEGNRLISADYSQIELVVLAHLSQDKNLCDAFASGRDVHAQTAARIFGIDESAVDSHQRRTAKVINFGVMYGMSSFRLSQELRISRQDAAAFIETYFKTYSGVREFIDNLIKKAETDGYVSTIFGRRRPIPTITSRNRTEKNAADRIAVNTPIQGSAADIVKKAMLDLDAALTSQPQLACRMLLQVHDELILECPSGNAEQAAILVKKIMESAVTLSVPLRVSVETGIRWGDFH